MNIKQLEISEKSKDYLLQQGFTKLYPPQALCIKAGLLGNKNMLLAIPTASGKTLAATLAIIKHFETNGGGVVVYLTPLNALTLEKYQELRQLEQLGHLNIHVGMQAEGKAKRTASANIRIMTNEALMASLVLDIPWTREIRLVVADEIHTIHDETRGPDLEMALVSILKRKNQPRIIALSATVGNPKTIAKWLEAKYISSDWRPVKLKEGVLDGNLVRFNDGTSIEFAGVSNIKITTAARLGIETVKNSGQVIIFAGTRRNSVSAAQKASQELQIEPKHKKRLEQIADKILDTDETTDLVEKLAQCVRNGAAFHHAGLNERCRKIIEDEFRARNIFIIAATPTLAAGVNMPARRIIITSYVRFGTFMSNISVLEYKQMCGRAGRPKYDTIGESIILPSSSDTPDDVYENYINAKPENIQSKLGLRLAFHTLVCIGLGKNTQWRPGKLVNDESGITQQQIIKFFDQTLARIQYEKNVFDQGIIQAITYLENNEMVDRINGRYVPTKFGKIVNRNIMEPSIAVSIKKWLNKSKKDHKTERLLMRMSAFVQEIDMFAEYFDEDWTYVKNYPSDFGFENVYNSILSWINEKSLKEIEEKFKVQEGHLHWYNRRMDRFLSWVIKISEFNNSSWFDDAIDLQKRINYGVKEELLELVSVKQVGRIRARRLYNKKIKNRSQLTESKPNVIAQILNQKTDNLAIQIIKNAKRKI